MIRGRTTPGFSAACRRNTRPGDRDCKVEPRGRCGPASVPHDKHSGKKFRDRCSSSAAESPVRSQQEMEAEHIVFEIAEHTAGQKEISAVVLIFAHPGQLALFTVAQGKRDRKSVA